MAIVGGNAAILAGSSALHRAIGRLWYRAVSVSLAGVRILSLTMSWVGSATAASYLLPVGTWERGCVYSILSWQTLTALCLIAPPAARR